MTTASPLLETLWHRLGFVPDERQREAILHTEGPLYLPAAPGSGKTRVLLWRSVNLIAVHGVEPTQIYLSTFTEKAAQQLREGLRALLGAATAETGKPYDIGRMYVGTIHSLCKRILSDREFRQNRRRGRAPTLLDDLDQYLFVQNTTTWRELVKAGGLDEESARTQIPAFFSERSASRHAAVSKCIAFFNRLSEECVDAGDFIHRVDDTVLQALLRMYVRYRELLQNNGSPITDFSLLQQEALNVVLGNEGAGAIFRHVIVDEYQDTNTVQERIFFRLAQGYKNLCVVGDDDQALYRFRGATVENFVRFPERCSQALHVVPRQIPLVINYRSRSGIVSFCQDFIRQCDWKHQGATGAFRVESKEIVSDRQDPADAVVLSVPAEPVLACDEIAAAVRQLIIDGAVQDPNQVAFLYPSLKSEQVARMMSALEQQGIQTYAPRAMGFLETSEAVATLGVFALILGRPNRGQFGGREYHGYFDWLDNAERTANELVAADHALNRFVADRSSDVGRAARDYEILIDVLASRAWDLELPYDPERHQRALVQATGLSSDASKKLISKRFHFAVLARAQQGNPFKLKYIIKRATSVDWSLLDLFYQLCLFGHWSAMFDAAERPLAPDEGPVANLGLLTDYLARFMEQRAPIISGDLLTDGTLSRIFFGSYLYALHRRGESEFENAEDPFPKGRVPFLTIHQAKGLEFPVVVLGNPRKNLSGPPATERIVRGLLGDSTDKEPLNQLAEFDAMRMFYVALSRAKNLLILPQFRGKGQVTFKAFGKIAGNLPALPQFDWHTVPAARKEDQETPHIYSYTGDYLAYLRCPRQYMVFRKFDFVPSRSQTLVFGTLVHRTMDDLHHHLIAERANR